MEFLRFGSSIPGNYWGCCACDIIQNFKVDPDSPASIEVVCGDSNSPTGVFFGMTYREVFWSRLRQGTFGQGDMPNHAFIAILTDWQLNDRHGLAWLKILKEAGFEFLRTVSNSVYDGEKLGSPGSRSSHPNYIFGLFRNIGQGAIVDQFTPPKAWTDVAGAGAPEVADYLARKDAAELQRRQEEFSRNVWNRHPVVRYSEADVVRAGVPVTLAGRRALRSGSVCSVGYPQELKSTREAGTVASPVVVKAVAFPVKA